MKAICGRQVARSLGMMLVMSALLAATLPSPAQALKPTDAFYVNDYVGVLPRARTAYLVSRGQGLYTQNGVQVVAVIVDNYIGESMAAYANWVFNEFGIGVKGRDTGALLIVAVDDGEVRIEVGDGLSGLIPDSKVGAILDRHFMPPALAGDLAGAVEATYLELIREGSRLPGSPPPPGVGRIDWLSVTLALLLIGTGIMLLVISARRRRQRGPYTPPPFSPPPGSPRPREPWPPGRPTTTQGYPRGAPVPRLPVGPVFRYPGPSTWGGSPSGRGSSGERPRPSPRPPSSPIPRPSHGGGGKSVGGGAARRFPTGGGFSGPSTGGFGGRSSGGGLGLGGSRPGGGSSRPSGGRSGGGGRSSGGGAGRSFKK